MDSAKIDIETGLVGPALGYDPASGTRCPFAFHPETGAAITDETVPGWPALKQIMIQVARRLPFPGIVGWDVALTPDGIVIVEGNGLPGLDIHEAHESLIADVAQKEFWERHKYRYPKAALILSAAFWFHFSLCLPRKVAGVALCVAIVAYGSFADRSHSSLRADLMSAVTPIADIRPQALDVR